MYFTRSSDVGVGIYKNYVYPYNVYTYMYICTCASTCVYYSTVHTYMYVCMHEYYHVHVCNSPELRG